MYVPLSFLMRKHGENFPVYGTTHFYITTTHHHPPPPPPPPRKMIGHVWRFSILIQSIFVISETKQNQPIIGENSAIRRA